MGMGGRYASGQSGLDAIKKAAFTGASGKPRPVETRFTWALDQVT